MTVNQLIASLDRIATADLWRVRGAVNHILKKRPRTYASNGGQSKARTERYTKQHTCPLPTGRTAHYTQVWERSYDKHGKLQRSRLVESRLDRIEGRLL